MPLGSQKLAMYVWQQTGPEARNSFTTARPTAPWEGSGVWQLPSTLERGLDVLVHDNGWSLGCHDVDLGELRAGL